MRLKIGILASLAWRVPPIHYGPWELVSWLLAEGLTRRGHDVTLFASGESITTARLDAVCRQSFHADPSIDEKVWEHLHIAHAFEASQNFDILHNNYDFVPLTYARLSKVPILTTIHGFSNSTILPAYKEYQDVGNYVSISLASRHPELSYIGNVYHGIDVASIPFQDKAEPYFLVLGRIHPDKGVREAIAVAKKAKVRLKIAGIIHDQEYFDRYVQPELSNQIEYLGSLGGEEKLRLVSGAQALLHLVGFDEPFGLSMIESMASGVPVIAFRRGSIPEVVTEGVSGFVVESVEQALEKLEPAAQLSRARVRQEVSDRFSLKKMIDGYEELYRMIIEK